MGIDRAATLKNIEKLLKQGKLEPAIAEYVRIVADQPRDFNSVNALGDLYVRARKIDKAVEQFIHIADSLNEEGFLPKAAAVYKKIIKIKPDHEHALLQAAEIAASQSLYADARAYLTVVVDKRAAAGDKRGVAQMKIRMGNLDPADYPARINAARARTEINDPAGAVRDLKEIAAELTEKNRQPEAVAALREASKLVPDDEAIRGQLFDVYLSSKDYALAGECAVTAAQHKNLAAALEAENRADDALQLLRSAARLDPADAELRVHLAKTFVARGDMASASEYLTEEAAGNDSQLLLVVAEMQLRAGDLEKGVEVARRVLAADPTQRDAVAIVGWNVAEQSPDAGYAVVLLAAELSTSEGDFGAAAAALQEFVTRVPSHLAALMRLVEICVDGGLEATLYSAQAQLADAYIAAGMADEARFISEDLVAREPWDRANIERFRKTLVMMNEPDPDALIAERLSGQSPFTSTELNVDFPPFEEPPAPVTPAAQPAPVVVAAPPTPSVNVEVDLSIDLDSIKDDAPDPGRARLADLDNVFDQFRQEASRKTNGDGAESEFQRALTLQRSGDVDGAVAALHVAARSPKLRFAAASTLARIFKDRGQTLQALEWMERAVQAPAPTPDEYHQLLYELAEGLEASGETGRALAICLELQSEAGAYRDVTARVDRLAKVQPRG